MSFGFSVGDFLAVGRLAVAVYKQCRDAPTEYKALASEVRSLQNILQDVEDLLEGDKISPEKKQELLQYGQNCNAVLIELQAMMTKYHSLDSKSRRTWDRLRWDQKEGSEIRSRITSNITALNAFYHGVTSSTVFEIQKALEQLRIDIQSGRREGSLKSASTIQVVEDDEDAWRELIRDLEDLGVTADVVNTHRALVLEWIVEAINSGSFQEQTPSNEASSIRSFEKELPVIPVVTDENIRLIETIPIRTLNTSTLSSTEIAIPTYELTLNESFWALPKSSEEYKEIYSGPDFDQTKSRIPYVESWSDQDAEHYLRLRLNLAISFLEDNKHLPSNIVHDPIALVARVLENITRAKKIFQHTIESIKIFYVNPWDCHFISAALYFGKKWSANMKLANGRLVEVPGILDDLVIECENKYGINNATTTEYTIFMMYMWAAVPKPLLHKAESFYTSLWKRRKLDMTPSSLNGLVLHLLGITKYRLEKYEKANFIFREICFAYLSKYKSPIDLLPTQNLPPGLLSAATWCASLSMRLGLFSNAKPLYRWITECLQSHPLAVSLGLPPIPRSDSKDVDIDRMSVREAVISALSQRFWCQNIVLEMDDATLSPRSHEWLTSSLVRTTNQPPLTIRDLGWGVYNSSPEFFFAPEEKLSLSAYKLAQLLHPSASDWDLGPLPFDPYFKGNVIAREQYWFTQPPGQVGKPTRNFFWKKLDFETSVSIDDTIEDAKRLLRKARVELRPAGRVIRCKPYAYTYGCFEIHFVRLMVTGLFIVPHNKEDKAEIMKALEKVLFDPLRSLNRALH